MGNWYYVLDGKRQGPVDKEDIQHLYNNSKLKTNDYVWTKGYENWVKIGELDIFKKAPSVDQIPKEPSDLEGEKLEIPSKIQYETPSFEQVDPSSKIFFIKTGADRGARGQEYGPFSMELLKKLFKENRINSKTFAFYKGLESWTALGDFQGFEQVFNAIPEKIKEEDKRAFRRKPFIARMFIENNNQVFEGICRDVSIGGMQVLVDHFPASSGDRVSINVHPENSDHHFTASGEIVRMLEGGLGFSFRFLNLDESSIKAINSYLSDQS